MKKLIFCLLLAATVNVVAQVKVSELPAASSVGLTDVLPIVADGQTKKATVGQVADAVVGRANDYTGNFAGGSLFGVSLTVRDGVSPPFFGATVASIGANTAFGLRLHSEQNNGLFASSRNGQAAKFIQIGWDGGSFNTPVVRVARGIGTSGINHSPLLTLETAHSEWSDGDAILVKRDGVDTFRLTADGVVHSAGMVLSQAAEIPTNSVPAGSASVTNWMVVNLGGVPTFVATNHAAGGWLQKPMWP
jgi:hypothetical protein